MAGMISSWLDLLAQMGIPPVLFGALLIGLVVAWAGTQVMKRLLGMDGPRCTKLAMALAFLATYSVGAAGVISTDMGWPGLVYSFWTAVASALGAPLGYKALRSLLRRYRPKLAAALSGDRPEPDEHEGGGV